MGNIEMIGKKSIRIVFDPFFLCIATLFDRKVYLAKLRLKSARYDSILVSCD